MHIFSNSYTSPLGNLLIRCSEDYITEVSFMEDGEMAHQDQHQLIDTCIQQLEEYFSGARQIFSLPLEQDGTAFQKQIWQLLCAIPYGKTISYQSLSKQYGDPKAIRAVAAANGRNNIAIIVPCHRVIGTNQTLVGYAGGLWRKKWLLNLEMKHTHGVQEMNFEPMANSK